MRFILGLGANLGDRTSTMREAVRRLGELGTVGRRSRIYSSAPVGGPPQPPYHNAAVELHADLDPMELLAQTQTIERALGRDRTTEAGSVRWGPRPIDVDLLLAGAHGELELHLPGLTLPHPRLHERAFALAGVVEIDPDLVHPTLKRPLTALLREQRGSLCAPTGERL